MHILQIIIPFLIAGFGTCFAGIILDHVQYWEVFTAVDELYLLLPALLGIKGNLQMTLASRFSTHSHLGHIQTKEDLLRLSCASLSLNQCLSTVVTLSASLIAILIHLLTTSLPFSLTNSLLLMATAFLTSSVTSFILDTLMILVVQVSTILNINPDNVATPIAASLGDTTALVLCAIVGDLFYTSRNEKSFFWLTSIVILVYIALIPVWALIAQDNYHTAFILTRASNWCPLLTAMGISMISGMILKVAIQRSSEIALFQPVICGVGGNLVAVQASRLATMLHQEKDNETSREGETVCINPMDLFLSTKQNFAVSRLLMILVIPSQCIFYFFCIYVDSQKTETSVTFLLAYLVGSQFQVIILLYLAHVLTYALWRSGIDPDSSSIPYLTSISDVLGSCVITLICLVAVPGRAKPSFNHMDYI